MRRFILSLLILCSLSALAQRHEIGSFFSHLPYNRSFQVALTQNEVYCHAGPSIFSYQTEDEQIERLNTITGLSDMGVQAIGSDPNTGAVFIGYENGNLDLIKSNEIINFEDIRRSNIVADKSINHFHFSGTKAYISTGFGLAVFDIEREEFVETYLIGTNESYVFVNASYIFKDKIYCTSTEGVFYAPISAELVDFRSWVKDTSSPEQSANYNHNFSFNDTLFINKPLPEFRADSVYYYNGQSWSLYPRLSAETNYSLKAINNKLCAAQSSIALVYDEKWQPIFQVFDYGTTIPPSPRDVSIDSDGIAWIADFNQGLIRSSSTFDSEVLTPSSPKTSNNLDIKSFNNQVLVAAGGRNDNWLNTFSPAEVYMLEGDEWTQFDRFSLDTLTDMRDLLDTETSDGENFYFATYGSGLVYCTKTETKKVYTAQNSDLQAIPEDSNYVAVSGLFLDDDENLWVANGRSNRPLHVLSSSGEWISFPISGFNSTDFTGDLIKTSWGHIWLYLPKKGILVYDYNNTLDDFSDDSYRILNNSPNNGNLPSNELKSIAEDKSGAIWVGTNLGLRIFFNASQVLVGDIQADEILIQQDGYTEVLFDNENITTIYVDGANRKWIGTQNSGAFLLSADGKEEILSFNEDNSPLFSNEINAISVLESTGEVFIGTERGIIAYKSDATNPLENFDQIYVYPNPVPEAYAGVVAIKNTTENAIVKITDVTGNLVYETRSNGGQAVWSGLDLEGNKLAKGVYLVYCSDINGNFRGKTKFLYLR